MKDLTSHIFFNRFNQQPTTHNPFYIVLLCLFLAQPLFGQNAQSVAQSEAPNALQADVWLRAAYNHQPQQNAQKVQAQCAIAAISGRDKAASFIFNNILPKC